VIFDTGSLSAIVSGNDIENGALAEVTSLTVGEWSLDLASPSGKTVAMVVPGPRNRIVVGLRMMQSFDVYYDPGGGRIGLLSH